MDWSRLHHCRRDVNSRKDGSRGRIAVDGIARHVPQTVGTERSGKRDALREELFRLQGRVSGGEEIAASKQESERAFSFTFLRALNHFNAGISCSNLQLSS